MFSKILNWLNPKKQAIFIPTSKELFDFFRKAINDRGTNINALESIKKQVIFNKHLLNRNHTITLHKVIDGRILLIKKLYKITKIG
ncbi:MAG TPA: hypothetical protein DCS19_07570, partial [Flavobacterium sp.]|nr:hypothetical protein [Flavobacterium sp.]